MIKCLKCEVEIKEIEQLGEDENLEYGQFQRWVMTHIGSVDRGEGI